MLFSYSIFWDINEKLLITSLSFKDRILHFALLQSETYKDHQFYINCGGQTFLDVRLLLLDFNMSNFILKYLVECSKRTNIGFLPCGMIFTPFFAKFRIKLNEEQQVLLINSNIMITASHLHKMHPE